MSAETKWTEGPWRYDRTNGSPTTGQHMIAGSVPGYLSEVRDCGSGDVSSNAQLIASAPELYEIAEKMALALERLDSGHPHIAEWVAISAKARGEQ